MKTPDELRALAHAVLPYLVVAEGGALVGGLGFWALGAAGVASFMVALFLVVTALAVWLSSRGG